jgi:hypothetical protein
MHENEVEFLASRESQRSKAPVKIGNFRIMDEADRAAVRTREDFRRLAAIEFREMEQGHPDVVRRALEEVNWSPTETSESEPTAGPVIATAFGPRADLHQMEVVRLMGGERWDSERVGGDRLRTRRWRGRLVRL